MKINNPAWLDALCGEYIIGTLRGPARRRFERALSEEPLVSLRLKHWQGLRDEETITLDLEAEAVQYLVRAITNLVLHDHSMPSEGPRFFEWLATHRLRLNLDAF